MIKLDKIENKIAEFDQKMKEKSIYQTRGIMVHKRVLSNLVLPDKEIFLFIFILENKVMGGVLLAHLILRK